MPEQEREGNRRLCRPCERDGDVPEVLDGDHGGRGQGAAGGQLCLPTPRQLLHLFVAVDLVALRRSSYRHRLHVSREAALAF